MKTPALRLLDQKKIKYVLHHYSIDDGLLDGKSVAKKLGVTEEDLFKTLVFQTAEHKALVFLVPVSEELDLKKAAALLGTKKLSLLPLQELKPLTGYEKGGCSPLAMKKPLPVYLSQEVKGKDTLLINGGALGLSIQLSPTELEELLDLHYVSASLFSGA